MGDADQTIYSSRNDMTQQPSAQKPKRNPLLIGGGIGCALLLCAALLIGGGAYFARDQINQLLAGSTEEPTAEVELPTEEPTATSTPVAEETEEVQIDSGATDEPIDQGGTEISAEPEIGEITFALGATEDHEAIDPADTFEEGITEVHAVFDYSGILPEYSWERVWYLDGEEVLRSEEVWGGEESGVFDYFINAGGEPLTPGEWVLELYVEGELLATGSFTIEPAQSALAAATPEGDDDATATAQAEADSATATPTPSPTATTAPTAPPASSSSASGGGTYKLVYTKWDGGRHNLYISDTNGSSEQFVLHRGAGPSWSRDGNSIFFYGEPGVNQQNRNDFPGIGSCELPGVSDGIVAISVPPAPMEVCQAQVSVYQGPGWNVGSARWVSMSPDGSMLAYDAKPGGNYRIYFLGTADNQQFKFEIVGEQADWSPDSQKIVYRSGRDGKTGIWISNRDDSGHTQITSGGNDSFPAWSPDGRTIVFHRDEGGNVDLYAVNVDGTNLRRLTEAPGPDTLPIFTPGGQIIFRSARSGSWAIWKMNADGSNQQEIIPNAGVGNDWAYSKMDVR